MVCSLLRAVLSRFDHLTLRACNKQLSSIILHTDAVIWSYTTVPVAFRLPFLCIFTNLELQERRSLASQGTLTTYR